MNENGKDILDGYGRVIVIILFAVIAVIAIFAAIVNEIISMI
jgi:hypothetical protein